MRSDSPSRSRSRRWLLLTVGIALVAEVTWLVSAYLALNTGLLKRALNRHPDRFSIDWSSGRCLRPGRIQLSGVQIRGHGRHDRWTATADHAEVRVALLPLRHRRVVGQSVTVSGITFHLESHPAQPDADRRPEGSTPGESVPAEPTTRPAPPARRSPGTAPWILDLPSIDLRDVRDLRFDQLRIACPRARIAAAVRHTLRGPFEADIRQLDFPEATWTLDDAPFATQLTVRGQARLDPIHFHEVRGAALLGHVEADLRAHGNLATLAPLTRHLGPTTELALEGEGLIDTGIRLEAGRLLPGTQLRARASQFALRMGPVVAEGVTDLLIDVAESDGAPRSVLTVNLDQLRFHHRDDPAQPAQSGSIRLRAEAADPVLPHGFRHVAVELDVGPLTLPDARVLNPFLTHDDLVAFERGAFQLAAEYRRDIAGAGQGTLRVEAPHLAVRVGDDTYAGTLEIASRFARSEATPRMLSLDHAHVLLTNAVVVGEPPRSPEGWHLRLDLDRATLALDDSRALTADVVLNLLDLRPLLALLREDPNSSAWARFVPNIHRLHGSVALAMDRHRIQLHDLRLRGDSTEVLAHLTLAGGRPDGIAYARYGILSAGFDFRHGARDWTLFGAKRRYLRHLAEMGLTNVAQPEADTPDPDHDPKP